MNIQWKLTLMSVGCSLVPLAVASAVLIKIALTDSRQAIEGLVAKELVVLRDLRKRQIENYFNTKRAQVLSFSKNATTAASLQWFAQLHRDSNRRPESTHSAASHQPFADHLRSYQTTFGFSDIHLANRAGDLVYSVSQQGILADDVAAERRLDRALEQAGAFDADVDGVTVSYQPRGGSAEAPVLRMAAPILQDEVSLGHVIFEIDMVAVDQIMTDDHQWHAASLGATGETFLVADDFTARSSSRFLHQQPELYSAALKADAGNPTPIGEIRQQRSNIGLQTIETEGVTAALDGQQGLATYPGYMGRDVIAAYAPLEVPGLKWVVLAEISEEEALQPLARLRVDVLKAAAAIVLFFSASSVAVASYLSSRISRPIRTLCRSIKETQQSKDLTRQIHVGTADETGEMAAAFNEMLAGFRTIILQVIAATEQLSVSAEGLSAVTTQTRNGAERQQDETGQLASAVNQMAHSFRDVARSALGASESAEVGRKEADETFAMMGEANAALEKLRDNMSKSRQVTLNLKENSDQIETVLDVIKSVAEQTNLLALNAAIEAARAGEHGRGFAVVADEVRTLAVRTQRSADEIRDMITHLQGIANETAILIDESNAHTGATLAKAQGAKNSLEKIISAIADINDRNSLIASATEEQSAVAEEINRSVNNIASVAEDTAVGAARTSSSSDELAVMSAQLNALVNAFKVDENKQQKLADSELF